MRLTNSSITTLEPPGDKADHTFFDDTLPGFGIRCRRGAHGVSRSWVLQYDFGGRTKRMPLGPVTALPLAKARAMAQDLKAKVRLGQDPVAEKLAAQEAAARAIDTFGLLVSEYLAFKRSKVRARTYTELVRHLEIYAKPFHSRPLEQITHKEVSALRSRLTQANGPFIANRVGETLSALGTWAKRADRLVNNPFDDHNRNPEKPRERTLTADELRAVWNGVDPTTVYGQIVRLIVLTGCRREEIGSLRWSEVDFDREQIVLSGSRVKNQRPFTLPLSEPALAILAERSRDRIPGYEPVFSSRAAGFNDWGKAKVELDARIGIPAWRLHDLRRTFATGLGDLGILPHVIEAALNHVSGSKRGVAGIYNRSGYEVDKRKAAALWADHVLALAEGRSPKIVALVRDRETA
jgi:integrase